MTATSSRPPVAVLGLGIMGAGMAGSLLNAGFPLAVYNRSPGKATDLVSRGARYFDTPAAAVNGAEIVVGMVADDEASRQVWLGESGALGAVGKGTVLIECSTLSPEYIRELAEAASSAGSELLDAPVAGSRNQAASGELRFFVGGAVTALERARPVLEAMGKQIEHVGPIGSGSLLKLINNFLCGVQLVSIAEALTIIERSALDRDQVLSILTGAAPGSPLIRTVLPRMTANNFAPHFHLSLMAKDMAYALAEGKRHGVTLETAQVAIEYLRRGMETGFGEQDMSAVIKPMRQA